MHDLDRTMFETDAGGEFEAGGTGETAALEQENFLGILSSILGESSHEQGSGEMQEIDEVLQEIAGGTGQGGQSGGSSQELMEMELTSELLEVTNEEELDQFIADLVSRAAGAARRFAASPTGVALGGIVKDAAGKALPVVGRAVGDWVTKGGGDYGERAGKAAGALLGLELEGLSQEDREFESARSVVSWAVDAIRRALSAGSRVPPGTPPVALAKAAATAAAQQRAPGLVPVIARARISPAGPRTRPQRGSAAAAGRWERRGNTVVLHGL